MERGRYFERQFAAETITRPAIEKKIGSFPLDFPHVFPACLPSSLLCRRTDCPESG